MRLIGRKLMAKKNRFRLVALCVLCTECVLGFLYYLLDGGQLQFIVTLTAVVYVFFLILNGYLYFLKEVCHPSYNMHCNLGMVFSLVCLVACIIKVPSDYILFVPILVLVPMATSFILWKFDFL